MKYEKNEILFKNHRISQHISILPQCHILQILVQ